MNVTSCLAEKTLVLGTRKTLGLTLDVYGLTIRQQQHQLWNLSVCQCRLVLQDVMWLESPQAAELEERIMSLRFIAQFFL